MQTTFVTVLPEISLFLIRLKSFLWALVLLLVSVSPSLSSATNNVISLNVAEDVEVEVSIYPATGDKVLLWLACNEGRTGQETKSAEILAKQGVEVWLPDFLSAHFLPQGPSSIYKITGAEVALIIDAIVKKYPDKKLYLIAGGRANAPLLKGAVTWEKQNRGKLLAGALLLYPRLNLLDPLPGTDPVYIKAVGQEKLDVIILEGERTPNRWGLPHLSSKLALSGANVQYQLLPKVRGYFYTRSAKTAAEKALAEKLHEIVKTGLEKF